MCGAEFLNWLWLTTYDLVEAGRTVPDKATFLKGFGRRHDIPMLVLHQTSRHAGADGAKLTMSSGSFGGEQQATAVIGVRRKKYQIAHEINELIEKLTVRTASVHKTDSIPSP